MSTVGSTLLSSPNLDLPTVPQALPTTAPSAGSTKTTKQSLHCETKTAYYASAVASRLQRAYDALQVICPLIDDDLMANETPAHRTRDTRTVRSVWI